MSVPGGLIQRTKYFCVHQDPLLPIEGFLVIASRRHIQSISEMEDIEYGEFSRLVRNVHRAIKVATQVDHLTLVQEENSMHFHLWFFPWTESVIGKFGQPSLSKIREIMAVFKTQQTNDTEWKELEQSINKIREQLTRY